MENSYENTHVRVALKKLFSGIAPAPIIWEMTYHKAGGQVIVTPYHGMVGWRDGKEYIYNKLYRPDSGWYRRSFYQAIKSIDLGMFDHRIITPDFYLTVSGHQPEVGHFRTTPANGDTNRRPDGRWNIWDC